MILDWLSLAGPLSLAVLVVFLPGLAIGVALRLRGLALAASAPLPSVGLLATLAVLFPRLGVRWGLLSVAVALAVIATVVGLAAWWVGRRTRAADAARTRDLPAATLLVAGLVIGGGLNAARLMSYMGVPAAISQTNDAVFHLNALRWIAETGSASSFDITGLLGVSSFYPGAWHAVTSLVVLDVDQIPAAANAVALVIAAVVWPLGCAFLTRVVTGGSAAATAIAAALSGASMAFPQLMFEWGVLYPYALSVAILPATLASSILAVRSAGRAPAGKLLARSAVPSVVAAVGVVAIAFSQPSSLLVWALLLLIWMSAIVIRRIGAWSRGRRALGVIVLAAAWAMLAVVWLVLARLAGPVLWAPYRGIPGALADVALSSHSQLPPSIGMSVLLALGMVAAIRIPGDRWLAVAWAAISVLYVAAVALESSGVKRFLTGPWYGDSFRFTALVPVVTVPLAAIGLVAVFRWVSARRGRHDRSHSRITALTLAAIAVVCAAGIALSPVVLLRIESKTDPESRYALSENSYLSADEVRLLQRLPDEVPENGLLIANPSTGAAFAYLLSERDIVPRTWAPPVSDAWNVLAARLRDAEDDPAVCEALAAYGQPEYVLDFGPGEVGPGLYVMPGMTGFEGQPGFEELDREGDASLWRITACR